MDSNLHAPLRIGATATAVTFAMTGILGGIAGAAGDDERPEHHRVERGDTLGTIAEEYGLDGRNAWRKLWDANPKLDDPNLIVPGQKLNLPDPGEKIERRQLPEGFGTTTAVPARRSSTTTSRSASRSTSTSGVWWSLAACESGGNWSANTGNGYYGGLQFSLSSWRAVGGSGYPHDASAATQIAMGQRLQARQGWGAWPGCSAKLGLR